MTTSPSHPAQHQPQPHRSSVLAQLAGPAVVIAVVAVVAFVLLELVKTVIVVLTYALGIAFVVLAVLAAPRLLRGRTGAERWHRIRGLAEAVGLGAALIVIAHLVSHHGWLLIVVPVAWVTLSRLVGHVSAWRRDRKLPPSPPNAPAWAPPSGR